MGTFPNHRIKDLTGSTFGRLTVIGSTSKRSVTGEVEWECVCTCGKTVTSSGALLKRSRIDRSCGCVTPGTKPQDITGMVFEHLTAVRPVGRTMSGRNILWECLCRCGVTTKRTLAELRKPHRGKGRVPKSCGCARHGFRSPRYLGAGDLSGQIWARLRNGAARRGYEFSITIQEAWDLFEQQGHLCALTGLPIILHPSSVKAGANTASLDRIDSSRGYVPGNIQWVHRVINLMKQTLSSENFVLWCRAVVKHQDATAYARGESFGLGTKDKPHLY